MAKKPIAGTPKNPQGDQKENHGERPEEDARREADALKIDPIRLRRKKGEPDKVPDATKPESVTAGGIGLLTDYAFNPTREKIREMTSVNRMQAMLLPQLDLVGQEWRELIEVAEYRQDSVGYQKRHGRTTPVSGDPIDEYTYRFAQWSKSRDGMNLKSAVELAMTEIEGRTNEEGDGYGAIDAWGKD